MEKKDILYVMGAGGLLWLLLRGKKQICPNGNVLYWKNLAQVIARKEYLTASQILAIIHDQSLGNELQSYYIGGVWKRYGLMGVPLAWAASLGFEGDGEKLMDPYQNLLWGSRIMKFLEEITKQLLVQAGIVLYIDGIPAGGLYQAYSWYKNGRDAITRPNRTVTTWNHPYLQDRKTIKEIARLARCYEPVDELSNPD
jgi:soluble lytic murein transglycosylase-like protein